MLILQPLSQVPFHLHGPHGVLRHLEYLLETKGSAVVCVAEGAGQVTHMILLVLILEKICIVTSEPFNLELFFCSLILESTISSIFFDQS